MVRKGFYIHSTDDGRVPPWEYVPTTAISGGVTVGLALVFGTSGNAGKLVKCGQTTKPEFICMYDSKGVAPTAGDRIPVIRVAKDIVFETTCSADNSSVAIGTLVTLSADADQVTATPTNGVAEVVEVVTEEASSPYGGVMLVRF